ncbi:hypothetical protein [Mucilaginibacter sp. L196]|uniref:hypothetical protein n=1 Tax=Mucilaginibacter sp. L196 TaxID=1641870 RepID=UPI00131E49E3|nr:hypothetical protein [Mucilaginibacter sp. L196]
MKNAIFTICAKNYLAHAKTLGDTIKQFHPECDFTILLSDEIDGEDIKCDYKIIESKNIGIVEFEKMSFQYDVIEFSTSVKPFFIKKLFNEGFEKVLYIDPDMVVYSSLDFLFYHLDTYHAILTPHLLKPYVNYTGATTEEELLFVGIYNLGFFGIKNSAVGINIADWWMQKLSNQCYADKEDALHVDQKWMDFLPSLYTNEVLILRHPGMNLAFWNFHERALFKQNNTFYVDDTSYPLTIMHFSGLDADNAEAVCRKQTKYTLSIIPEYREIFEDYVINLYKNDLERLSIMPYKYNYFDDGAGILKYHRRLYRGLVNEGEKFDNLFSTNAGSYYSFLEKNNAMLIDNDGKYKALKKTYGKEPAIFKKVFKALLLFKAVFGIKRYYLMMRFFAIYNRFEKQTFLVKK